MGTPASIVGLVRVLCSSCMYVRAAGGGRMQVELTEHAHGKQGVRVAKKWTDDLGFEQFIELSCRFLTWSPECEASFTQADNRYDHSRRSPTRIGDTNICRRMVIATDTIKNVAYIVAKKSFSSAEEYGLLYENPLYPRKHMRINYSHNIFKSYDLQV